MSSRRRSDLINAQQEEAAWVGMTKRAYSHPARAFLKELLTQEARVKDLIYNQRMVISRSIAEHVNNLELLKPTQEGFTKPLLPEGFKVLFQFKPFVMAEVYLQYILL